MRRLLGLGLLFAGISAGAAMAQGAGAFDGQYVGELTLVRVIQGDCSKPPLGSLYPLTVAQNQVRFLYTPRFSTMLVGSVDRNGVISATARAHKGVVKMTGRIRGSSVAATILSPSCQYDFKTKP
ncbi:MAG: hypothetical protein ACM3JG_16395 [Thiohalocapsa sp.]